MSERSWCNNQSKVRRRQFNWWKIFHWYDRKRRSGEVGISRGVCHDRRWRWLFCCFSFVKVIQRWYFCIWRSTTSDERERDSSQVMLHACCWMTKFMSSTFTFSLSAMNFSFQTFIFRSEEESMCCEIVKFSGKCSSWNGRNLMSLFRCRKLGIIYLVEIESEERVQRWKKLAEVDWAARSIWHMKNEWAAKNPMKNWIPHYSLNNSTQTRLKWVGKIITRFFSRLCWKLSKTAFELGSTRLHLYTFDEIYDTFAALLKINFVPHRKWSWLIFLSLAPSSHSNWSLNNNMLNVKQLCRHRRCLTLCSTRLSHLQTRKTSITTKKILLRRKCSCKNPFERDCGSELAGTSPYDDENGVDLIRFLSL